MTTDSIYSECPSHSLVIGGHVLYKDLLDLNLHGRKY